MNAENSGKPLGGRDFTPNPAEGTQCSPGHIVRAEGLAAPPQEPHPRSQPSTSIFGPSSLNRQSHPTVFISPPMFTGPDTTLIINAGSRMATDERQPGASSSVAHPVRR